MTISWSRWIKISLILAFVSIAAFFSVPPAASFESDLYAVYPLWMWAIFGASLVLALGCAIRAGVMNNSTMWLVSLFVVSLLYCLLFALPVVRQYALFGRGSFDILTHLGYVKTITTTGQISVRNWYPLVHILGASLRYFGVPRNGIAPVLQSLFVPFYAISLYIYTRERFGSRAGIYAGSVALPLIFGVFYTTIHPSMISYYLLPLIFVIYHQDSRRWRLMTVLMFVALPFYHLVTTLMAVGYTIVTVGVGKIKNWAKAANQDSFSIVAPIMGMVTVVIWYLGFSRFGVALAGIIVSPSTSTSAVASQGAALTLTHRVIRGVVIYGDLAIFLGGTLTAVGLVTLSVLMSPSRLNDRRLNSLIQWGVGVVAFILIFVGPINNPVRSLRYNILFGIVLIAIAAALLRHRPALPTGYPTFIRQASTVALAIGVITASLIGIAGIYPEGNHYTQTESESVRWTVNYTAEEPVLSLQMSRKNTLFEFGTHAAPEYWRFRKSDPDFQLPSHLGYPQHDHVASLHESPFYILTKAHDRRYYKSSYREQWSTLTWYTDADIRRLRSDSTADHIYTSGLDGASVWWVNEETD